MNAPAAVAYVRPQLYPAQEAAIFAPERYALIEASTKAGKTTGCIAWLLERAAEAENTGRAYWWIAPVFSQAEIAFRRMKRGLPRWYYRANETKLSIQILVGNKPTIWFKSAEKPDSLYGDDVFAAVIDEASRVREESWHAIRSTLTATRAPCRMIGNVKGRKNWFYKMARRAESGEPGMHYAKLTAHDAVKGGVLDPLEIEQARRDLPDHVFRELYLAEAGDDDTNPFGLRYIAACIRPLSKGPAVAYGIDLAKSIDWTVVIGLDRAGHVCRFERWQGPWNLTLPRIRAIIGRVPTLVDSTGVGDPVVEGLQVGANVEGYKYSATSKQMLMEGLAVDIQQGAIGFPEGVIVSELENFEYAYTRTGVRYSAPEGLHDDCVNALALARARMRVTSSGYAVAGSRDH